MRTANGEFCYTSHAGKTAVPIGSKPIHQQTLAAPNFGDDLISVAQLTAKGNSVLFSKQNGLLLGPSDSMNKGFVIRKKGRIIFTDFSPS